MLKYSCKKINNDIVIDGNLHKPEWEAVEKIELVENVSGGRPRQGTCVGLMWNDRFLYAAFRCRDNYLNATYRGFNDKLYEEEVVEVFIDDNRDYKTYIEIEVNPLNAVLHYAIHNDLKGKILAFARTDQKIETAVFYDQEQEIWNTEMAIPFGELVTGSHIPPKPGDSWFVNLFRIDRPKDGNDEYSAWSPTGKINFHLPEYFGELVFKEGG